MKLTIETKKLREAMIACLSSVGTHLIPSLQCVLLDVSEGACKLTTFNGRTGMQVTINDGISEVESGSCLMPAKKLKDVLSVEKSETLVISLKSTDRCLIKGDDAKYNIATLGIEQYPILDFNFAPLITMNTTEIRTAIKALTPFVCDDIGRPQMKGILLDFTGDDWFLVAGDGKRLIKYKIKNNGVLNGEIPSWVYCEEYKTHRFLISDEMLKNILQMDADPLINIGFTNNDKGNNHIMFSCGNIVCKGIAIEGMLPDWVNAITTYSKMLESKVSINNGKFSDCMKKSMIGNTHLTFSTFITPRKASMLITNMESEFDYSDMIVYTYENIVGEPPIYCVDPQYVLNITSINTDDDLIMYLSASVPSAFIFECTTQNIVVLQMLKDMSKNV